MQLHPLAKRPLGALCALTFLFTNFASAQLGTPEPGYKLNGATSFTDLCSGSASFASFADGTYLLFDGLDVEHRTAHGALLKRHASFPFFQFPSFVRISPDETTAYLGESSGGQILELDLASGTLSPLANLTFNFDFAFDNQPGLAYVSAASGGFGLNSIHSLDLASGTTAEVARVTGFSGPLTVDPATGDVLLARLPDTFPFPADQTDILRFPNAALDSGAVLSEPNASVELPALDNCSSLIFDASSSATLIMETGTPAGSILWRLDGSGVPAKVLETPAFSGTIEITDAGLGTQFGPWQPDYVAVSYLEGDCFGSGEYQRVTVRGDRPGGTFDGPMIGNSGAASFDLTGGIPGGFASLYIARSGAFGPMDVIESMGGVAPIALRADLTDYGRRFPMQSIDSSGETSLPFTQDVSLEGAVLAQWLVFDANGTLVTTSTAAINRSRF